jgi:hypothetical protein
MDFSKVGPNQSIEWGQFRVSKSTKTIHEGTLGRAYSCPVCLVSENRKQNADVVVEEQQRTQANFELPGRFMGCETKCVVGES